MPQRDSDSATRPGIGAGYASWQLSKTLLAESDGLDPRVRQCRRTHCTLAAGTRARRAGYLQYGSRTPLADVPAWVSREVSTGGFATGRL
ncbi:hypothetical protein SJI00_05645 [Pseudomonas sp. RP23018S]|uniref:hypothetical protein n=1 Tax=Pseudomonas sp. RP23018S TaxID=3096037 RepID=UPI002ACA2D7D|nr:hypothetical protein [Pseudomonas sp. RP23018S]MDZ5602249.1 hypothetical protein [Pseudomonas sp. RP23018S]